MYITVEFLHFTISFLLVSNFDVSCLDEFNSRWTRQLITLDLLGPGDDVDICTAGGSVRPCVELVPFVLDAVLEGDADGEQGTLSG